MSKFKTINVFSALQKSSYRQINQEMIMSMLFDYFNTENSEVYLRKVAEFNSNEKVSIFVIKHIIMTQYENKSIPVTILIYIPSSFPTTPPEFYFYRTGNVKINEQLVPRYVEPYSMKIHFENDITWKSNLWSMQSILVWLSGLFKRHFPLFAVNYEVKNDIVCSLGNSNIEKVVFEGGFEEPAPAPAPAPAPKEKPQPKLKEEQVCALLRKEILAKIKPMIKPELENIQKNKTLLTNTAKQVEPHVKPSVTLQQFNTTLDKGIKLNKQYEEEIEKDKQLIQNHKVISQKHSIDAIDTGLLKINDTSKQCLHYMVSKINKEEYVTILKSLIRRGFMSRQQQGQNSKDSDIIKELRRSFTDIYILDQKIKKMNLG